MASASLRISTDAFSATPAEHAAERRSERESLDLLQIRRFLHDAVADHAGKPTPTLSICRSRRGGEDLLSDQFGDLVAGHGAQRVGIVDSFRIDPDWAGQRIVLHHADRDVPGRQDADCLSHLHLST